MVVAPSKWSLVLLLVLLHLLLHFLSWERRETERGEGLKTFDFCSSRRGIKRFRRRASLREEEQGKHRPVNVDTTIHATTRAHLRCHFRIHTRRRRRRNRVLSHSRGVGRSFDANEIFSLALSIILSVLTKKHIEGKKRLRFEEKRESTRTRKRSNGVREGVARTSPGDAIICRSFRWWWWWWFSRTFGCFARFCVVCVRRYCNTK